MFFIKKSSKTRFVNSLQQNLPSKQSKNKTQVIFPYIQNDGQYLHRGKDPSASLHPHLVLSIFHYRVEPLKTTLSSKTSFNLKKFLRNSAPNIQNTMSKMKFSILPGYMYNCIKQLSKPNFHCRDQNLRKSKMPLT